MKENVKDYCLLSGIPQQLKQFYVSIIPSILTFLTVEFCRKNQSEKFGKSFDQLTIETVSGFLRDSKKSNFKL